VVGALQELGPAGAARDALDGTALHGLLGIGALDRAGAAAVVERLARSYLGVEADADAA
jgi:hypothetical protein